MVEIKNLNIEFDGRKIFENFSLKITKGEKIIITGKSGRGKSTLLKFIMGYTAHKSGFLYFDDIKIDKNTIMQFRYKTAYISQGVDFRNEKISVLVEEIASFKSNKSCNFSKNQINMYLKEFDLNENIKEKNISEISGGEKQRIGIIAALLLEREIYILDEITASLDIEMKEKVSKYFANMNATVIVVSHDECWKENKKFRVIEL